MDTSGKRKKIYPVPDKHRQKNTKREYKKALRSFKRGLQRNATGAELRTKHFLECLGILFDFQRIFLAGGHGYIVDFYLPLYQMVIEIDGGYHCTKAQGIKDYNRTTDLLKLQNIMLVRRFDNDEIINMDITDFSRELVKTICPFTQQEQHSQQTSIFNVL